MDHVVLDLEVERLADELPQGWNSTDLMGYSVCVVYEVPARRFRVFGPREREALLARIQRAERVTGYNSMNFDYPVLFRVERQAWIQGRDPEVARLKEKLLSSTDDLLRRIWIAQGLNPDRFAPESHGGWGLDEVAQGTLGVGKIASGGFVGEWQRTGNWWHLANYCLDDVALTRDLSEFIDRYGYVYNGQSRRKLRLGREWRSNQRGAHQVPKALAQKAC